MSAVPRPEPEGRDELAAMTLIEHLSELRSRLIKCLVAVLVGATVMWFFYNPAFRWLAEQLQRTCSADQQCAIIQTNPLQGFSTRMTFSGYGGIVLAMPVILWQVWRFIMPGLYPKERRLAWPFTISAVLLFVMGAAV
jgi:sec-independent protein translocase protein TatC